MSSCTMFTGCCFQLIHEKELISIHLYPQEDPIDINTCITNSCWNHGWNITTIKFHHNQKWLQVSQTRSCDCYTMSMSLSCLKWHISQDTFYPKYVLMKSDISYQMWKMWNSLSLILLFNIKSKGNGINKLSCWRIIPLQPFDYTRGKHHTLANWCIRNQNDIHMINKKQYQWIPVK